MGIVKFLAVNKFFNLNFQLLQMFVFLIFYYQELNGQIDAKKVKINLPGNKGMFSCSRCDKQFNKKASLTLHMQHHTGRFSYYCDKCHKGFPNGGHFRDHMNKHDGVRFHCEICSKSFTRKRVYQAHLSVHTAGT